MQLWLLWAVGLGGVKGCVVIRWGAEEGKGPLGILLGQRWDKLGVTFQLT